MRRAEDFFSYRNHKYTMAFIIGTLKLVRNGDKSNLLALSSHSTVFRPVGRNGNVSDFFTQNSHVMCRIFSWIVQFDHSFQNINPSSPDPSHLYLGKLILSLSRKWLREIWYFMIEKKTCDHVRLVPTRKFIWQILKTKFFPFRFQKTLFLSNLKNKPLEFRTRQLRSFSKHFAISLKCIGLCTSNTNDIHEEDCRRSKTISKFWYNRSMLSSRLRYHTHAITYYQKLKSCDKTRTGRRTDKQ